MVKNIFGLYIGVTLKLILSLLIDRHIAINLSPDLYGTFKYYITLLTLLSTLSGLGMDVGIVRVLSNSGNSLQKKKKIMIFSFFSSIIASSIFFILCQSYQFQNLNNIDYPREFHVISLGIISLTLNKLFLSSFSTLSNVKVKVIINDFLQPFILFVGIISLRELNLENLILIYIFSQYAINILNIVVFYVSFCEIIKSKEWLSSSINDFLIYCLPIFLTNILVVVSTEMDKIILREIISKNNLGIYYSVSVLSSLLGLILVTLVYIYLPFATKNFLNKKKQKAGLFSSYISRWLMLFSFIPFWLLFNFPEEVITLFFSEKYLPGAETLTILAVAHYINISTGFTGQNLIALGDSKGQLYIRFFGLIISIPLSILLGNYYGEIGVAITINLSLILTNSLQVNRIKTKHNVKLFNKNNVQGFLFILLMILILKFINTIFKINHITSFFFNILFFSTCLFFFLNNKFDKKAFKLIKDSL